MKNRPDTPKMTNGLIQHIKVEESTSTQWVKSKPQFGRAMLAKEANKETTKVVPLSTNDGKT